MVKVKNIPVLSDNFSIKQRNTSLNLLASIEFQAQHSAGGRLVIIALQRQEWKDQANQGYMASKTLS